MNLCRTPPPPPLSLKVMSGAPGQPALYCIVLYCIVLYCIVFKLYCIVLLCFVFIMYTDHRTVLYCNIFTDFHRTKLHSFHNFSLRYFLKIFFNFRKFSASILL